MRLAVYTDYAYHLRDGRPHAERAFAVFLSGLAGRVERLALIGRVDPRDYERGRYAIPEQVAFVQLPFYRSLAEPLAVGAATARSLWRFWRSLDEIDVVWLLGPHPLAIGFAVLAAVRGRRVRLGVRQDLPAYARARHPRRRWISLAARVLDGAFRLLARGCPTVVVGPALARRYARARQLLELTVSLVSADEIVSDSGSARRIDAEATALSVGRLDEEKNPLMLADVLAALRGSSRRWRLVVCGEGPMEADLRERLAREGVADRADLRGYVPLDRGMRELYRGCDALLHVSWTEGLPQTLVEAFAAGLPIVATDVGGIREAVGEAALLVAPGESEAAAHALERIAADQELREELIDAGLRYAREHTMEAEVARVADFLSDPSAAAGTP